MQCAQMCLVGFEPTCPKYGSEVSERCVSEEPRACVPSLTVTNGSDPPLALSMDASPIPLITYLPQAIVVNVFNHA
eukprot:COSAG05_NODE_846_length_6998_cov_2.530077_3_plen_76_part_00